MVLLKGGKGSSNAYYRWADGDSAVTTYQLSLTVSDGVNSATKVVDIIVNNREPGQIFSDTLSTETLTPIILPDIFEDVDGDLVNWIWEFEEGVNLDGGVIDRTKIFVETVSNERNPTVAWSSSGLLSLIHI